MGGHGALIMALKNRANTPARLLLRPSSTPIRVPWGIKALTAYLGEDESTGLSGIAAN